MKTRVTVQNTSIGWVVLNNNVQVGEAFNNEPAAQLAAHHYRHAPSLQSQLKIKRIKNERGTAYTGRPFWSVEVHIQKMDDGSWRLKVWADDIERKNQFFPTLHTALLKVQTIGNEKVMTHNILNPEAGEFEITRDAKGGCCDPATETYHCM